MRRLLLSVSLCGGFAACSFAPHYSKPTPPTPPPAQYQESGDWQPAAPADSQNRGAWWTVFQDPVLDALENRVTAASRMARQTSEGAKGRVQRATTSIAIIIFPLTSRPRQAFHRESAYSDAARACVH